MSDFQYRRTVVSRKSRHCPECRSEIPSGTRYSRETGRWEGDLYSAFMCLPCRAFTERYVTSMQHCGSLNGDEVSYTFGSILEEAAEYLDHRIAEGTPYPEVRQSLMALFDPFDEAERAYRARERDNARRARRRSMNLAVSRLMILGMSQAGQSPHLYA